MCLYWDKRFSNKFAYTEENDQEREDLFQKTSFNSSHLTESQFLVCVNSLSEIAPIQIF